LGNNITISSTIFTNAGYTSSTIYTSTPVDSSYFSGSPTNPIFPLNPAVSTPNPPIIPANTMITNGESYIYTNSTQVNFTISILTTSNVPIGSPSQTTTTTPSAFGSATPNTFTFTDGVFISTALQVRIQANTGGIQVNFGTPTGGSFVNQDFCGFLQGYTLGYSQGTINVLPPTSSYTFTGLTNGTLYYFQVAAVNIYGTAGSYSAQNGNSNATPATIPYKVTGVLTTAGPLAGDISVSWTALSYPLQTGGLVVTYTLQYREVTTPTPSWTPTSTPIISNSYVITGLANATTYEIEVKAVNAVGSGPYSSSVQGVTFGLPGIPTGLTGFHGDQQVSLTWTAPTNTGLTSLTGYVVEHSTSSSGLWTPNSTSSTSYIVTGLTNGTPYFFRVSAVNIVGQGQPSSPIQSTPSTIPIAPVIIPSVTCDNQQVLVTWYPPVDDGGAPISSYFLRYTTDLTAPITWSPTSPYSVPVPTPPTPTISFIVPGLTNGTQYYFQVAAVNLNGTGPYSANSTATPSITPQPPIPITTTAVTSTSIAVSWTTPTGLANTGGNPVTGYIVYWTEISSTGTIISTNSTTISGTPPGTPPPTTYTIPSLTHATLYEIQISSVNCSGVGPLSSPPLYVTTSSIPPSAPTNVLITNCNTGYTNSVILTWTAPADDGGSPITNYVIYYRTSSVGSSPAGTWYTYDTNSAATTATISFLSPSTSYDFKIAAQNAAGVGIFSSPIVSSSSYNPPTTPTNLVATNVVSNTSSNGSIVLTWNPSTQEGAQSISHYIIEYKICEFGGWITYPTIILSPTTSETLSNIGTSSNVANNVPYLFRVYAVNSCGAQSDRSNIDGATSYNNDEPTRLWSRFNLNCSGNITSIDNLNRDMLRKGQVLQYPVVGTLKFSRATLWSMAAKNQLTRKKAWASQSEEYTYPNTTNINNQPDVGLRQTPTSLVCWRQPPAVICNSSTASDVPGNPTTLCISKNAPFNNFRRPITYLAGGTKFPVIFSK
jgi:titin